MDQADISDFDRHMMAIALTLARRGLGRTAPNPSVGAVVADEATGELIAAALTAPGGRPHAEPIALAEAGARARGKTIYVTLEPCSHYGATPPCVDAVIEAGPARVVVALEDPDPRVSGRGLERMRRAGIQVVRGLGAEQAHWIARGHILRVTERRPLVQIKLACDALGEIPRGASGKARFVTGELARQRGHLMRAQADAILVGRQTVADDDPDLTCRLPGLSARSPIRLVLSRSGAGLAGSRLVASARVHPVWALLPARAADSATALAEAGVKIVACSEVDGALWLPAMAEELVRAGVTRLLVEGGPTVWRSFSSAGLIDEVVVFHARADTGVATSETVARAAISRHVGKHDLELVEARALGDDDMLIFRVRWRGLLRRATA